jgi:hypothetical protein
MNRHLNKIVYLYLENELVYLKELLFATTEILTDTSEWICYNDCAITHRIYPRFKINGKFYITNIRIMPICWLVRSR